MTTFSANASTLGSLHQIRYALCLLLQHEESTLRLETLDDIDLEQTGTAAQLLQLKHRAPGTMLTDADPDLWKTLRVWSTLIDNGEVEVVNTLFTLVTTAKAQVDTAPWMLRATAERAETAALATLQAVASGGSKNKQLKSSFEAFNKLGEQARSKLVARIYVLDDSDDIARSRTVLEQRLALSAARPHRAALADRLEGWWFDTCVRCLRGDRTSVAGRELFDKVYELSLSFRPDALPIDFYAHGPSDEESASLKQQQFVDQLELLAIQPRRVENAIRDYYRAVAQRSRWASDDLLVGDEVESYEDRLRDEWDRVRLHLLDRTLSDGEEAARELGRSLLSWMELDADIRIREQVSEPYVMRGSFHILADAKPPTVWWHPDFVARLEKVLAPSDVDTVGDDGQ